MFYIIDLPVKGVTAACFSQSRSLRLEGYKDMLSTWYLNTARRRTGMPPIPLQTIVGNDKG
jgi:hypothetical protein